MGVVLRVTSGPHSGEEFLIDQSDTIMVGRSSRVQIPMIKDLTLSREHFQVESQPPLCHLIDLGSTNGTKVNGLRVERVVLREGDVITAGDSEFSVHYSDGADDGEPLVTCAGCGDRVPVETSENLGAIGDDADPELLKFWLCEECQTRKLKFPKTGPDYLIDEWIGGGGMGEVFRARQLSRNRPVAIKMISSSGQLGDKARAYFRREIEVLRDLLMPSGECHPTIVAFYELIEIDSQFQLVMEYVDGKNCPRMDQEFGPPAADRERRSDRPSPPLGAGIRPFEGLCAPRRETLEPPDHGPGAPAASQADRFRPGQELRRAPRRRDRDPARRHRRFGRLHLARSHPQFP